MNTISRSRIISAVATATCLLLTVPAVLGDAKSYSRTLESTAWIITSAGDTKTSTGTGVYVDAERRLVLTNAHVVGVSRSAVVFFPDVTDGLPVVKRKHYLNNVLNLAQRGKVVAVDRRRDLALIQLPEAPKARAIELADKSVPPGTDIELIGNPGGSDVLWIYTSGTVRSVYEKKFRSDHGEHDFKVVETQTPIRRGDSGGPVVNADGKLVGIAQSFSSQSPLIGFSVGRNRNPRVHERTLEIRAVADEDSVDRGGYRFHAPLDWAFRSRAEAWNGQDASGVCRWRYGVLQTSGSTASLVACKHDLRRSGLPANDAITPTNFGNTNWIMGRRAELGRRLPFALSGKAGCNGFRRGAVGHDQLCRADRKRNERRTQVESERVGR